MPADVKSCLSHVTPEVRSSNFAKIFPEQSFPENITKKLELIERAYDISDADYDSARICATAEVDFPKKVSMECNGREEFSTSSLVLDLKSGTKLQICQVTNRYNADGLCVRAIHTDTKTERETTYYAEEFLFEDDRTNQGAFAFSFQGEKGVVHFSFAPDYLLDYDFRFSTEDTEEKYGFEVSEFFWGKKYFDNNRPEFVYVRRYMEKVRMNPSESLSLLALLAKNDEKLPYMITPSLYWSYPATKEELSVSVHAIKRFIDSLDDLTLPSRVKDFPIFGEPEEYLLKGIGLEFPDYAVRYSIQILPLKNGCSSLTLNIPDNYLSYGPIRASITMLLDRDGNPTQYAMKLYPATKDGQTKECLYAISKLTGEPLRNNKPAYEQQGLSFDDFASSSFTLITLVNRAIDYALEGDGVL